MNFITGETVRGAGSVGPVVSLIPADDAVSDVGTSSKRWRDGRFVRVLADTATVSGGLIIDGKFDEDDSLTTSSAGEIADVQSGAGFWFTLRETITITHFKCWVDQWRSAITLRKMRIFSEVGDLLHEANIDKLKIVDGWYETAVGPFVLGAGIYVSSCYIDGVSDGILENRDRYDNSPVVLSSYLTNASSIPTFVPATGTDPTFPAPVPDTGGPTLFLVGEMGHFRFHVGGYLETSHIDNSNGTIVNVSDPTNPQDVATKNYVDTASTTPNYTTIQRDALTQTSGLVIYNTDREKLETSDGTFWSSVISQTIFPSIITPHNLTSGTSDPNFLVEWSSHDGAWDGSKMFNGVLTDFWITAVGTYSFGAPTGLDIFEGVNGSWVKITLPNPKIITKYQITSSNGRALVLQWRILTSMDGITWTVAAVQSTDYAQHNGFGVYSDDIDMPPTIAKYIVMQITKLESNVNDRSFLAEINFDGVETVEPLRLESYTTADIPTGIQGNVVIDSIVNKMKFYSGGSWRTITSS